MSINLPYEPVTRRVSPFPDEDAIRPTLAADRETPPAPATTTRDLSGPLFGAGLLLVTTGVWLNWGLGWALIAAGVLLVTLVIGVVYGRQRREVMQLVQQQSRRPRP